MQTSRVTRAGHVRARVAGNPLSKFWLHNHQPQLISTEEKLWHSIQYRSNTPGMGPQGTLRQSPCTMLFSGHRSVFASLSAVLAHSGSGLIRRCDLAKHSREKRRIEKSDVNAIPVRTPLFMTSCQRYTCCFAPFAAYRQLPSGMPRRANGSCCDGQNTCVSMALSIGLGPTTWIRVAVACLERRCLGEIKKMNGMLWMRERLMLALCFVLTLAAGGVSASPSTFLRGSSSPCDDSFPSASHLHQKIHDHKNDRHRRRRRLVPAPDDDTRRSYAPLCADGVHVDVRRLSSCASNQCFAISHQACMHITSFECTSEENSCDDCGSSDDGSVSAQSGSSDSKWGVESDLCGVSQCYSNYYKNCFHVTSLECTNPQIDAVNTVHPIVLRVNGAPSDYELAQNVLTLIMEYVKELLEEHLRAPLGLVKLTFDESFAEEPIDGELAVPLMATVSGPYDASDFALTYIVELLERYLKDLIDKLKEHDTDAFGELCVRETSFVCHWGSKNIIKDSESSINSGPEPNTSKPEPANSLHYVGLLFDDMPDEFSMSRSDEALLVRFIESLLVNSLDPQLELIGVSTTGVIIQKEFVRHRNLMKAILGRRLASVSIPLVITVRGRKGVKRSTSAQKSVMEAVQKHLADIEEYLRSCVEGMSMSPKCSDAIDEDETALPTSAPNVAVHKVDVASPTSEPSTSLSPTEKLWDDVHLIELVFESAPPGYEFTPDARYVWGRYHVKRLLSTLAFFTHASQLFLQGINHSESHGDIGGEDG